MRRYISLLILLAFGLRALVPVGFMPGQAESGDGSLALVICTSSGLVQVDESDGQPGTPHVPDGSENSACAFGILSSDVPMPTPAIAALPWVSSQQDVPPWFDAAGIVHRLFQSNLARGPPLHLS